MSCLPQGYEHLKTEKKYTKLSKFKEGDTKIRIVQAPIGGWLDWKENKPYRYRPDRKPKHSFDPEKPLQSFWSLYIWDYEKEDLFILDLSQSAVIKALVSFAKDEEWGDFMQYDIKIKKQGTGKETKYQVMPLPHKPLNDQIKSALECSPVRLEALYEGKDPWTDLDPSGFYEDEIQAVEEESERLPMTIEEMAIALCSAIEIPDERFLPEYLLYAQSKTDRPIQQVVEGWLVKSEPFLKSYKAWVAKKLLEPVA